MAYMAKVFDSQEAGRFTDRATWDKSRAQVICTPDALLVDLILCPTPTPKTHAPPHKPQINAELVQLATEVGVDAEALNARLAIAPGGNSGTATTQAGGSFCACRCAFALFCAEFSNN